uniref:Uncharacterized protein n=1 Tax=Pseudodiaptomus poplesia TaxID=213370 RepID=A0A0U2VCN6_9MAXI|nr:hypothetical protein [Pseudodiaptomus poplesia]
MRSLLSSILMLLAMGVGFSLTKTLLIETKEGGSAAQGVAKGKSDVINGDMQYPLNGGMGDRPKGKGASKSSVPIGEDYGADEDSEIGNDYSPDQTVLDVDLDKEIDDAGADYNEEVSEGWIKGGEGEDFAEEFEENLQDYIGA